LYYKSVKFSFGSVYENWILQIKLKRRQLELFYRVVNMDINQ